ncbi:hypothetical protein Snoj_25630 [Streptomyces nojiriensis]|uniref:Uncharacterized protein n=1 Tax=Streptomyces nojiriensis TaxID=66374 RepID=A0ABQ3SKH3_9ACTN|nr:hypothetical protein JYK04_08114 [Streptomyces nojiriensis]GGS29316.1 hypothetical protein GCM10010205_69220 [Streptomyces nojiriensis]GHI68645.1 hypothetical protein Snoj_25630 [Streptomyces nojiriensis]
MSGQTTTKPRPQVATWAAGQTGPCTRCHASTRRYGVGGSPLGFVRENGFWLNLSCRHAELQLTVGRCESACQNGGSSVPPPVPLFADQ